MPNDSWFYLSVNLALFLNNTMKKTSGAIVINVRVAQAEMILPKVLFSAFSDTMEARLSFIASSITYWMNELKKI